MEELASGIDVSAENRPIIAARVTEKLVKFNELLREFDSYK